MAKLVAVILFLSVASPIIVSAVKDEKLAELLDEGVKIIDDIKDTEFELTVYRAQMILLGYRLSNEMAEMSKKLKSGDATQEELDKLDADIKALIDQTHLVEDTESGLIDLAVKRIYPTADEAQKQIKAMKA